ncbi:MAG: hypothetical protein ABSD12_11880 [Paraburkholderia sp.]|jgi:hypothetical protein
MLRMRQPMLETVIEVSEQLDGDATPLRAALAITQAGEGARKASLAVVVVTQAVNATANVSPF